MGVQCQAPQCSLTACWVPPCALRPQVSLPVATLVCINALGVPLPPGVASVQLRRLLLPWLQYGLRPLQEDKVNQVLPIGGPGKALSARDQANLLFDIVGKEPKYFAVPVALMDGIIGIFDFLAKLFPGLAVSGWAGA